LITVEIQSLTTQKNGNKPDENEDAFCINKTPKKGGFFQELRCAIADGATQTSFSSLWANLLVRGAAEYVPSEKRLQDILSKSQMDWDVELSKKKLPWYAEEKAKLGAFSTLLWVSIRKFSDPLKPGGTWKAIAVGDSNLLILREKKIDIAFPIRNSHDFGNYPVLLSSIPVKNKTVGYFTIHGYWLPGDEFILSTDAVAHFFLKQVEENKNPFLNNLQIFTKSSCQECFQEWIQSLRMENSIRNDDSTLVWIKTVEQNEFLLE
jgi:hypothetical protein